VFTWGLKWRACINEKGAMSAADHFAYFRKCAFEYAGIEDPSIKREKKKAKKDKKIAISRRKKKISLEKALPESPVPPSFSWCSGEGIALHIVGDNKTVVEWLNGNFVDKNPSCQKCISDTMDVLHRAWSHGMIRPRTPTAPFCSHVLRKFNTMADALATVGQAKTFLWHHDLSNIKYYKCFEVHFDGGFCPIMGVSSCGVTVHGSFDLPTHGRVTVWHCLIRMSFKIDDSWNSSSLHAELFGAQVAILIVVSLIAYGCVRFDGNIIEFPLDNSFDKFEQFDGCFKSWLELVPLGLHLQGGRKPC